MPKVITELALQSYAPGEYWDAKVSGFGVRVGARTTTFILKQHNSRRKLGHWPHISLQEARKKAYALKSRGENEAIRITFKEAVGLFLDTHCRNYRPRTKAEAERHLKRFTMLDNRRLASLTTYDFQHVVDGLAHTPSEANHSFKTARTFLRFCVRRRLIQHSPLDGLAIPNKETSRARVLTDAELQLIWRACEQTGEGEAQGALATLNKGSLPTPEVYAKTTQDDLALPRLPAHFATIVKLLILTGQRRGEIAALRAEYISNDTICLPASLTKNGRVHQFPIGSLAIALLSNCLSSTPSGLIFRARGTADTPFNGWSKSKAALDQLSGVKGYTLHDIRRTFSTRLAEMGIAPHVIERLLNHVSGSISGVTAIYNRASYLAEMRQAIDLWDEKISALCGGLRG